LPNSPRKAPGDLLRKIPYEEVPREKVKLPKRSEKRAYDDRSPIKGETMSQKY
jgi:hypothetical protein